MPDRDRIVEYAMGAGFALVAAVISPPGLAFITGRGSLSFRVTAISAVFAIFLALLAVAALLRGRLRRLAFYGCALTFPLALLAALEAGAVAVHLADVVAPLENTALLAKKTPWPTYLLTEASYYTTPDGLLLYRPWTGDGITFNALGLRTVMPSPKAEGEWRVAVSGGSAVWGWHVVDVDTIPADVQDILRREGHGKVTVYNFGIGGATLKRELALLEHFRATYGIDQVLFYTGANDVITGYIGHTNERYGPWVGTTTSFELVKTAVRLQAMSRTPPPEMLRYLDEEVIPRAVAANTLRDGILAAAAYCRDSKLVCDFALQPMMFDRKSHTGAEADMARTLDRIYPRMDALAHRIYADAMAAGPPGHMFDLSHTFDNTAEPLFLDHVHLNEAGNRIAAARAAAIIAARLPGAPGAR